MKTAMPSKNRCRNIAMACALVASFITGASSRERPLQITEYVTIPNVFTPDGDNINDEFYITSSGLKEFHIQIYDRWGIDVFESRSVNIRWDGRSTAGVELSEGMYYFNLKAISITNKDFSTKGFIQLLRNK